MIPIYCTIVLNDINCIQILVWKGLRVLEQDEVHLEVVEIYVQTHQFWLNYLIIIGCYVKGIYDVLRYMTFSVEKIPKNSDYYHHSNSSTRAYDLTIKPLELPVNSCRFSFFVTTAFFWNSLSFNTSSVNL